MLGILLGKVLCNLFGLVIVIGSARYPVNNQNLMKIFTKYETINLDYVRGQESFILFHENLQQK